MTVYVKVGKIPLSFEWPPAPFGLAIPISDRVFELRNTTSERLGHSFSKIQLLLDEYALDDRSFVSQLGLREVEALRTNVLRTGSIQLYFVDWEGHRQEFSLPADGTTSFGDLASRFSPDCPMEVTYTMAGRPLKRGALIDDEIYDPDDPIAVARRRLTLPVTFNDRPEWNTHIDVTDTTRISGIIKGIHRDHPEVDSVILRVRGVDVRQGKRLVKFDPNLEHPIIVTNISVPGEKKLLIELIGRSTVPGKGPAIHINVLRVSITKAKKVKHLPDYLFREEGLGKCDFERITVNGKPAIGSQDLAKLADNTKVTFTYAAPPWMTNFRFAPVDQPDLTESQPVRPDTTVVFQKMTLLHHWNRRHVLPRAISMSFWGEDFRDSDALMSYGFPANTRFSIQFEKTETLIVFDEFEKSTPYSFSDSDTVATLIELLAFEVGRTPDTFNYDLHCCGRILKSTAVLKDLQSREVRLRDRSYREQSERLLEKLMTFQTGGVPITLNVWHDCTLSALSSSLATCMKVDSSRVCLLLSGKEVSDLSQLAWDVAGPISVQVRSTPEPASPEPVLGVDSLASEWIMDFSAMKRIKFLGEGAIGSVALFRDPTTDELIAVKSFNHRADNAQGVIESFMREVQCLIRLGHPCVVPFIGYVLETDGSPAQIGTKYAENGSLDRAMEDRRNGQLPWFMDDTGIAIIVAGIVCGMKFIHEQDVIHRDLKPGNILIDAKGFAQIGDLGSTHLPEIQRTLTECVGTVRYMAPEVSEGTRYSSSADVWSFTLILYELLTGQPVFAANIGQMNLLKIITRNVRPPIDASMDPIVRDVIERGWSGNPERRCSFEQIWHMLSGVHFRLTPAVDTQRVADFLEYVDQDKQKPRRPPVARTPRPPGPPADKGVEGIQSP
jgi:hypothetical protein